MPAQQQAGVLGRDQSDPSEGGGFSRRGKCQAPEHVRNEVLVRQTIRGASSLVATDAACQQRDHRPGKDLPRARIMVFKAIPIVYLSQFEWHAWCWVPVRAGVQKRMACTQHGAVAGTRNQPQGHLS